MIISEDFDRFLGSVIQVTNNIATLKVVRTRGVGTLVLTNRRGYFTFANPNSAFVNVKKGVQKAMIVRGHDWLRDLLLAHNNRFPPTFPPPLRSPWLARFPPLNEEQALALARATHIGEGLSDRITLIEGPPGTGKTGVISKIVMHNIDTHSKWLLVAETSFAVQVCAERLHEELLIYGDSLQRIFFVGRTGIEDTDFHVSQVDTAEASEQASMESETFRLSPQNRRKVVEILQQDTKPRVFSLTSHISARNALLAEGQQRGFSREEKMVLAQLNMAKAQVQLLNTEGVNLDDHHSAYKAFDQAFSKAREYYIQHQARGIISTAGNAVNKIFRFFNPRTLIIEEASQLNEALAVTMIARNLGSVSKVVLVGDIMQNQPFTLKQLNEFYKTHETSLLQRLMDSGVPTVRLLEQYRMHPDIDAAVSKFFYSNQLINSPTVVDRPANAIWRRFRDLAMQRTRLHHSYFVHVPCRQLFRSNQSKTLMNPAHVTYIPAIFNFLRQAGAKDNQIAYFTYYKGQLTIMRTWETPELHMHTVDSAQGREYDFVILDLVTPGGRLYPLGFVADTRRMCVALSRARIGLLVFGESNLGNVRNPAAGAKLWTQFIRDHDEQRAVIEQGFPDTEPVLRDSIFQVTPGRWSDFVRSTYIVLALLPIIFSYISMAFSRRSSKSQ